MKNVTKIGAHLVHKDGYPVAIFFRDSITNENTIFMIQKASLDDIESLMYCGEEKIKSDEPRTEKTI